MGLNGESSVPEGGCNFTFIDYKERERCSLERSEMRPSVGTVDTCCWLQRPSTKGAHGKGSSTSRGPWKPVPWALLPAAQCS